MNREILSKIATLRPVYRINHREENLTFFREKLGLKVLLEEGAMVYLGGCDRARMTRLFLEESPADDGFCAVKGIKRHHETWLSAAPDEVAQVLVRNLEQVDSIWSSPSGYGFDVTSPEGDRFALISEGSVIADYREIPMSEVDIAINQAFTGLSALTVHEVQVNVADLPQLESFLSAHFDVLLADKTLSLPFGRLSFTEADGKDLEATHTWDLEIFDCQMVPDVDLERLTEEFSEYKPYLSADKKVLSVHSPAGLELWFEK